MLIIAYHTGGGYVAEADQLEATLQEHRLNYEITAWPDGGSWAANTSAKPTFILDAMNRHSGPLLYVDADARFRATPEKLLALSRDDGDIAVHRLLDRELVSSTVWLSGSPSCREMVEKWKARCDADPKRWDQKHLQDLLDSNPGRWEEIPLGPEYCLIFDISRRAYPGVEPVIEQMQASRRLKK